MSDTHGAVWWSELNTRNVDKAKDYYTKILGWTIDDMPMADGMVYHVAMRDGKPVAGIFDMTKVPGMEGIPDHWFTYMAVDDVDAATKQTKDLGGDVVRDPWDAEGVGRIAILKDAAGAAVGLMTPAPQPAN